MTYDEHSWSSQLTAQSGNLENGPAEVKLGGPPEVGKPAVVEGCAPYDAIDTVFDVR